MQIDHIQVDNGEDLYGHTRHAGVPVGQHFGVCVQGTAGETETRNRDTEKNVVNVIKVMSFHFYFVCFTCSTSVSDLRILISLLEALTSE